jgi:hypothetical protein
VEDLLGEIRASGIAHNVDSVYESGDGSLVSDDRQATLIPMASRATARRAPTG